MRRTERRIRWTTDDGEEVTFNVLEQTTLGGVNYLLVAEDTDDEEDGSFLILKKTERMAEMIWLNSPWLKMRENFRQLRRFLMNC